MFIFNICLNLVFDIINKFKSHFLKIWVWKWFIIISSDEYTNFPLEKNLFW